MYFGPAPDTINSDVFTELPERLRLDRTSRGSRNFLEGPSFDRAGRLYCVDIRAGRIYRVTQEGEWTIAAEYDGIPNGLKIHRDGRVFVADRKRGIVVLDPETGELSFPLPGPSRSEAFMGLNDLVFAANGDLYFTDQGRSGLQNPNGRVYRLAADGGLTCLIDTVPSPNGLVLNRRETELFIAVTRTNAVWRMELTDPHRRTGLFVQLASPGPDGLALDEAGSVIVAHPTAGQVVCFGKRGEPLYRILSCRDEMTTNIAFGGPDRRTLFMVESKSCSILSATVPVAGQSMFGLMPVDKSATGQA